MLTLSLKAHSTKLCDRWYSDWLFSRLRKLRLRAKTQLSFYATTMAWALTRRTIAPVNPFALALEDSLKESRCTERDSCADYRGRKLRGSWVWTHLTKKQMISVRHTMELGIHECSPTRLRTVTEADRAADSPLYHSVHAGLWAVRGSSVS